MTKQEYVEYKETVEKYLAGVEAVSTGACEGCTECADDNGDPWFSWSSCEICNGLAGDRYPWHGIIDGEIVHGSCCQDCMYYITYGVLDDMTMMEIERDKS